MGCLDDLDIWKERMTKYLRNFYIYKEGAPEINSLIKKRVSGSWQVDFNYNSWEELNWRGGVFEKQILDKNVDV